MTFYIDMKFVIYGACSKVLQKYQVPYLYVIHCMPTLKVIELLGKVYNELNMNYMFEIVTNDLLRNFLYTLYI